MKRSAICKLSIAAAVCCGVICGVAIIPLIVAGIFALFALLCLLCCVLIFIAGLFVWLFSVGQANIFGYANSLAGFGTGIFNFITPVAYFSFVHITPVAGGIALGMGILGIIFSSVGIAKAKKANAQLAQAELTAEASALPAEADETPEVDTGKKKKRAKKRKTDKGACAASLAVSIVFSVVAVIAMIVAAIVVSGM